MPKTSDQLIFKYNNNEKINYQTPEVLVTDLNLEGMLCQSGLDVSAASIETWATEEFEW